MATGAGGAGGQYARKTLTVVPGTKYAVVVGAGGGGAKGDGAAERLDFAATSVVAKGGAGGTADVYGAGSAGWRRRRCRVYAGGSGANGYYTGWNYYCGGGGGGGGAGSGAGGSASESTGGTGTAIGGGAGGAGPYVLQ